MPKVALRFAGPASALSATDRRALFDRVNPPDGAVSVATAAIIRAVRERGDAALRDQIRRYDGVELESLEVTRQTRRRALDSLPPALRRVMDRTAANIAAVHRAFMPAPTVTSPEPGITIERRPSPLDRVGVYAPGGRAAYPSTVLMGAIPARVAGVRDVVLCSPAGPSGSCSAGVLAAAELAGVDRLFAVGGAGAIAAMALGTQSVPRVDRIVGPGNAYVAEAKAQLAGTVGIDSPAGPSELLVIADSSSSPDTVAAELLAQAEHDPLACVVAVCIGEGVASRVARCLDEQIISMSSRDVIEAALRGQGAVLSVMTREDAVSFANEYAAEHVLVAAADPAQLALGLRNAGTIFIGESSSVAFGDYMTGANHVLPTGGHARRYSGLSTSDFVRWTTTQCVDPAAAARLAPDTMAFATCEGLSGHASAAQRWLPR
jgi:histidinol dehydrogenase